LFRRKVDRAKLGLFNTSAIAWPSRVKRVKTITSGVGVRERHREAIAERSVKIALLFTEAIGSDRERLAGGA
jgi:hypothetical protein